MNTKGDKKVANTHFELCELARISLIEPTHGNNKQNKSQTTREANDYCSFMKAFLRLK